MKRNAIVRAVISDFDYRSIKKKWYSYIEKTRYKIYIIFQIQCDNVICIFQQQKKITKPISIILKKYKFI